MPLTVSVRVAFGADLTDPPALWTYTDVSAWVRARGKVLIGRGGPDEFSTFQPSTLTLVLDNSDGRFTVTNPSSPYYGRWDVDTPIAIVIAPLGSDVTRLIGFVSKIVHLWPGGADEVAEVVVTAAGVLRRLAKGRSLRSPLYRVLNPWRGVRPIEYWPMEDGSGATAAASAVSGGAPLAVHGPGTVSFAASSAVPGSAPLPLFPISTSFTATVRPYTSPAVNAWSVRIVFMFPTAATGSRAFLRIGSTGTVVHWKLTLAPAGPDTLTLSGFNSAGSEVLGAASTSFTVDGLSTSAEAYGQVQVMYFDMVQNGANINWSYTGTIGGLTGSVAGTLGNINWVIFENGPEIADATVGHLAVALDSNYAIYAATAAGGNTNEQAWFRWGRLLAQRAGIFDGGSGAGPIDTRMGVEQSGTIITLLEQVIDADQGLGFERRDSSVKLLNRSDLYNAAPVLTLDHRLGQLAIPWVPVTDDQLTRNDWTSTRYGGGSARYTAPAVDPTSPGYDPSVAVVDDGKTVNLFEDPALAFDAQWHVHLGTSSTQRYPQVSIDLLANPGLRSAWLACDIGSRIRITRPPRQLSPDPIDLLIVGYAEVLDAFTWRADLNCVSAAPYDVWELEDAALGRVDAIGSTLLADAPAAATTLLVWTDTAASHGTVWSVTEEPYDVAIAGERLTATAVTSSPATFVNVAAASHASNASLTPALPASIQGGDALFLLAAIRNSGTGTVNTPAGWTHLFEADSMALFGKIAAGPVGSASTETTPTVTFSGGVANATTSAQIAAFRDCSIEVIRNITQANASAQNIAYPTLGTDRPNTLMLVLGWKQDDWTSVATAVGTEIGEPSTVTGDDQGLVWDYLIQTTPAEIAAGSFVVTGGAAAISRGAVVAIAGDVQRMTVTRAVNTVAKAQTAAAPVGLWRTGVLAL